MRPAPSRIPRSASSLTAICSAALVACGPKPPTLTSGKASLQLSNDHKTLTLQQGSKTLLTFHADSFQIGAVDDLQGGTNSFDPYWLAIPMPPTPPSGLEWLSLPASSAMKLVSLTADQMVLGLDFPGGSLQVTFKADAPGRFSAVMVPSISNGQGIAYLRIRPDADASEGFYGLGEWGDSVNNRGKLRPMQMEVDGTLESGDDENHVPVPLLIGSRGWGLFVESRRPGLFDVARQSSTLIEITFGTATDSPSGLAFHLFSEPQPLDILKHYYDVTGYPRLPASWALGPMMWRDATANQAQAISDVQTIRSLHLASSGIWFDRPYASGVETFDFDPTRFNDPPTMMQAIRDAGFHYAVWQAPYESPAGNQDPAPVQNTYAIQNGFFPPVSGLRLNQWGMPIDYTNAAAYSWWQTNLRKYTDPLGQGGLGVEGFKLDYGEDVVVGLLGAPEPWKFSDGSDEYTMHYGYTILYHQIYSQLLPPDGGFFLCRTGRWGDQVHGMIIWPGDLDASFQQQGDALPDGSGNGVGGLPAALIKGIGLSASGYPFYASDTGGYRHAPGFGPPAANAEMWTRWVESEAAGSAMEVGDSTSKEPWEYNAENGRTEATLSIYKTYASLHMRLFPYVWTYAQAMAVTGRPVVRPFGLAWPALGEHPDDQFMLGDYVLSAPVVTAGATSRTVLLPPGTWIGWWDGQSYDGGKSGAQVSVPADLDTLPLFLQAGGIVPMLRDTIDTLAPVPTTPTMTCPNGPAGCIDSFANDPGVLWIRIAPGSQSTSFTVYDGSVISQQQKGATLSLSFKPAAAGAVFTEGALFEIVATAKAPSSVSASGASLSQADTLDSLKTGSTGWFWQAPQSPALSGTLWIKVSGATSLAVQ